MTTRGWRVARNLTFAQPSPSPP